MKNVLVETLYALKMQADKKIKDIINKTKHLLLSHQQEIKGMKYHVLAAL